MNLPNEGLAWAAIEARLISLKGNDIDWRSGRAAVYTYFRDDDLLDVSRRAYQLYFQENMLGKRVFPSLEQMERDVVDMAGDIFRAPDAAAGVFTSGGTESIFLAVLAARQRAYARGFRTDVKPQIVACETLHGAFNKAGYFLGVDVLRTPMGADFKASAGAIESAISDRTIMIAASAPSYTHGVFDPIQSLGEIAKQRDLWFHVDACVGGFLAPFMPAAGYQVPAFDLSVPGVVSLSADIHKYGMAAKGASVVMFRSAEERAYTTFEFSEWPRGTYATSTFGGTRPAGSLASAWAVLHFLGRKGYVENVRTIMQTRDRLVAGIKQIKGVSVVAPGESCMLLYKSDDERVDIDAVAEQLGKRGWYVGRAERPKAIHLALNTVHQAIVENYLGDLREVVEQVTSLKLVGVADDRTY